MAEERVDSDYSGRPIETSGDTKPSGPFFGDIVKHWLDGRWVWSGPSGIFESDPSGKPDYSRPVDHEWPSLDEALAEADEQRRRNG